MIKSQQFACIASRKENHITSLSVWVCLQSVLKWKQTVFRWASAKTWFCALPSRARMLCVFILLVAQRRKTDSEKRRVFLIKTTEWLWPNIQGIKFFPPFFSFRLSFGLYLSLSFISCIFCLCLHSFFYGRKHTQYHHHWNFSNQKKTNQSKANKRHQKSTSTHTQRHTLSQ